MDMREKVARAIWRASVGRGSWSQWDSFTEDSWGRVKSLAQADAAIEAMQEPTQAAPGHIEVRQNENGSLDEIVATGAEVHLEQMDGNAWWMSIEAGGRTIHVNLTTRRAVITGRCDYVG